MAAIGSDIKKLNEDVHELKTDMAQVGALVDRLDVTIEKLTEVSSTVAQLLAVQGNRLEFQEKIQEKLQELVEKRRQETDDNIKAVYRRIEGVEKELQNDIENIEDKIINRIDQLQTAQTAQTEKISTGLNKRIDGIEKWMWTAGGAIALMVFIMNTIDITKFFT